MKKTILMILLIMVNFLAFAQITLVKDIVPGAASSSPAGIEGFNNKVFFSAENEDYGRELWCYDPSLDTAFMVYDLAPGNISGLSGNYRYDHFAQELNGKLYFEANGLLYGYDGLNPPFLVGDTSSQVHYNGPFDLVVLDDKLYFSARTDELHSHVFSYDPSLDLVAQVTSLHLATFPNIQEYLTVYNKRLYFCGVDAATGGELYMYYPLDSTTTLVKEHVPGQLGSKPQDLVVMNNTLFYIALEYPSLHRQIYAYNGIDTPQCLTTNVWEVLRLARLPFNNKLYFTGDDLHIFTNREVYALDLNDYTTQYVADICPQTPYSDPASYTVYANKIYFTAETLMPYGREFWAHDGLSQPSMIQDLFLNYGSSNIYYTKVINDVLYMSANDEIHGQELFKLYDNAVSVSEVEENVHSLAYPVPAIDQVNIRISLTKKEKLEVHVYDIIGKIVFFKAIEEYQPGNSDIVISLRPFPVGLYQFRINDERGEKVANGRIVKGNN